MTLPVAILAGGLARRLRPITDTIPKALVPIAGEPFAYHQLRLLAERGIERVVYCLGYLGEQVIAAVGDGTRFGLSVQYILDGPSLLGTAGAIAQALPKLGESFFILYGDSYLDCDYWAVENAFRNSGQPALMTVFKNEGQWDVSNVEFDGRRIVHYSKIARTDRMRYIDYGLSAVHRGAFEGMPTTEPADLAALYERLAEEGRLAAFEVFSRFYEVGSAAGLVEFESYLSGAKRDGIREATSW